LLVGPHRPDLTNKTIRILDVYCWLGPDNGGAGLAELEGLTLRTDDAHG
jgi:hypothetical protein